MHTRGYLLVSAMAEIHCMKAVSSCYSTFKFLFPIVLEFDFASRRFKTEGRQSRRYIPWTLNLIVVCGIITFGSSVFTVSHKSSVDLRNFLFCVIFIPILSTDLWFSYVLYWHSDDIALAMTRMHILISAWAKQEKRLRRGSQKGDRKWILISKLLAFMSKELFACCTLLTVNLVMVRMDPLNNPIEYFKLDQGLPQWGNMILIILRLIVFGLFILEAARLYPLLVCLLFCWFEMQSKLIDILKRTVQDKEFFRGYHETQVTCKTWNSVLSEIIRSLFGNIFFIIVFANTITIRFVTVIPFSVYWFIPSLSVIDISTVCFIFPFVTESHEETKKMIRDRAKFMKQTKENRKMLRYLRPISWKFGDSFILKRESKSRFYQSIVDCTVNGILL